MAGAANDPGTGDASRLVGRRRELAALKTALAGLGHRATTRFVVLSGEPGIGKTCLLDELARRGERAGHLVLRGRGTELERDLPFGVWIDSLDDHVAWLGPDRLRRRLGEQFGELSRVLPSAEGDAVAPTAASPTERYRAHRAVRALLEAIAAPRPLLVLLDDLHWADGASLELLGHLLRRPPRASLVLGLAFRSGHLQQPVMTALAAADRDGLLVDLRLGTLSESELEGLLGGALEVTVRDELFRISGGNPFYMLQLARSAARSGAAGPHLLRTDAGDGVPPAVAAALGQEIDALSEPARLLAQGAAVAGEPVELGLAAAAAGLDERAALAALDEPVAAALLQPTGVTRQYRFRHPIVRHAIYESAGEGWRLAAHCRAAAALEEAGASRAARVHHVERCAAQGDESAVALLIEAGHQAAAHAPASAVRWYSAARRRRPPRPHPAPRLLPQRPDQAQRRLELLIPLATCLASIGRLEQALRALLDAQPLLPASSVEIRMRLVAASATLENLLGRHRAAHARLLAALDGLPEHRSAAGGVLQVELAADALFDTDFGAMASWAEAARATARGLEDPAMTAVAAGLLCFARYGQGDLDAAAEARAEAAAAVDGLPDEVVAMSLEALHYLGFAEFFCEQYDEAIRHLRRGISVARASGQGQLLVPMLVGLAHGLEVRGRLHDALDTAEAAVEAARLAGNRQFTSWALVAEGWSAAMTGDRGHAHAAAEEAVELLHGLDESVLTLAAHAHTAAIFLEAGDGRRCIEEARRAGAPDLVRVEPGRRAWLAAVLARAELARGSEAGAEMWLARAERELHGLELPLSRSCVLHAQALLAMEQGEARAAALLAERAVQQAEAVGADLQSARSRALAGQALARAGDHEAAVDALARAEAELSACGAHRFRDEAARELRRLGRRTSARQRRSSGAGQLGRLSGRQREIAELVALGRSNREIAAELFLAEKTVEGHLSNIFAKLEVSSRAALAAAVARDHADQA
jgi:DNA-binding NarL/FixJ family response regulator